MNAVIDTIRTESTAQITIDTPLGALGLVRTPRGLAGAWFAGQKHHPGAIDAPERPDDPLLMQAARQLQAYFGSGAAAGFDLPLDLVGTPFQRRVWQALQRIPPGATRSYAQVAVAIGAPQAVRAVGAAVGRNPGASTGKGDARTTTSPRYVPRPETGDDKATDGGKRESAPVERVISGTRRSVPKPDESYGSSRSGGSGSSFTNPPACSVSSICTRFSSPALMRGSSISRLRTSDRMRPTSGEMESI